MAAANGQQSAPGDGASIDPVTKARTLSHMNKDHQKDLSLYLRHFNRLSAADAAGPELLDIDLTTMTIRSVSGTHAVAISPPMTSWADRRVRLAEMSITAHKALGLRDPTAVTISTWVPPRGFDFVVLGAVAFYFVCLAAVALGASPRGRRRGRRCWQCSSPTARACSSGLSRPLLCLC
jgi:hypothetical protein